MKNTKFLLILEKQIDKIVLAVFALISVVLLWVYVIGNPYSEKVRIQGRERTLSPSEIDRYVKQEAEKMLPELLKPAAPIPYNETDAATYDQLLQCSFSDVSSSVRIPYPGAGDVAIEEDRLYALPQIPALTDVVVADLRGAAKVPTEEITPSRTYASAVGEVEDIDLVSVSARFDVKKLYTNFQQSFMGPRLKTSWKDPALATPVFADLELQRRARQKNGQWGPWESIPHTKIDAYQKQRKELPSTLEQSQFGVNLLMPLYKEDAVQWDILQPESYSFSISRMEWLPPVFLKEALDIQDKEDEKAERQRREDRLKAQSAGRRSSTSRTTRRPTPTRRQPAGRSTRGRGDREMMPDIMGEGGYGITTPRTVVPKERTVDDVKKEFEGERLDDKSILADRQDLLVWAHDDTVEPGNTYQYRMRIGAFNPIAGKDWFEKDQIQYKNQVVLWSGYSEPTEVLVIPRRVYVFPTEVIASQTASNKSEGVKVEVAKYYLGQWRDFDFDVYQGQIIGYEVEDVQATNKTGIGGIDSEMYGMTGEGQDPLTEKVDFTTGITFVDVASETVWGSNLRRSVLYEMLYYDADGLQQMPVGKSNWSSDTRGTYTEIQKAMTRDVQRRGLGTTPGMMSPDMMMDPMMMEMMMEMQ
ncbi:MAG: hypothetical protein ACYTEN_02550 [Planctomycetota bacterium]|jgi:hypothetical protein